MATPETPAPRRLPPGALNELDSLALLRQAGLPVVDAQAAADADAAVAAAQRLGYPVVLKLLSAEVLHKSDVGGVRLNLRDADAVRAAHAAILADAARLAPGARIDGVLVAPMLGEPGVECILGVQRDAAYGPVVMVGLGGVWVEVHRDVSFRLAPFGRDDALAMIDELRGRRLLDAHRGRAALDVGALADALVALSRLALAAGDTLDSIDVNPFVVQAHGAWRWTRWSSAAEAAPRAGCLGECDVPACSTRCHFRMLPDPVNFSATRLEATASRIPLVAAAARLAAETIRACRSRSSIQSVTPELREWILAQAQAGCATDDILKAMHASGWDDAVARAALAQTLQPGARHRRRCRSCRRCPPAPGRRCPSPTCAARPRCCACPTARCRCC